MEKKQIIEAMHNRLHEIDSHAKAILFGFRARGTEHEGSDAEWLPGPTVDDRQDKLGLWSGYTGRRWQNDEARRNFAYHIPHLFAS